MVVTLLLLDESSEDPKRWFDKHRESKLVTKNSPDKTVVSVSLNLFEKPFHLQK